MTKRGRPRNPATLTPREEEVLALLREGLSNDAIAERLGISVDGAKFHVSQILSKLGVERRWQAAQWQGEGRGRKWGLAAGPLALVARKLHVGVMGLAGATGAFVIVAGIALLAWGVARSRDGGDNAQREAAADAAGTPTLAPTGVGSWPDGTAINPQPLRVAGEGELWPGRAWFVMTGCQQCDAPPTALMRIVPRADGEIEERTLFEVSDRAGPVTMAVSSAGSEIAITECSRGTCLGLSTATPDARTRLSLSQDGGVSWSATEMDGTYTAVGVLREGVILNGPATTRDDPLRLRLWPSGNAVQAPAGASITLPPFVLTPDVLLWRSEDESKLLTGDGSVFLDLGAGRRVSQIVTFPSDGSEFAVLWHQHERDGVPRHYITAALGTATPQGFRAARLRSTHVVEDTLEPRFGAAPAGVIIGATMQVPPAAVRAQPTGASYGGGYLPVLIDLGPGEVQPVVEPFLRVPYLGGRNFIVGMASGPFLRIATGGGCLLVPLSDGSNAC